MDLDPVVDELYGLSPSEFTATRDERAAAARQEGDRALTGDIKALRRPSTAAWAVNMLARHRSDQVAALVDLGQKLREAQETLSGDQIRALGRQRHQVVAGLARECRRLTGDLGDPISDSVERQVQETLEAALADPAAGRAVSSGRLVRPLSHAGLGGVDLDGAVAGPPSGWSPGGEGAARSGEEQRGARRDEAGHAGREAQRAAREAERADREAQRAEREAQRAEREAQLAEREAERADKEAGQARDRLSQAAEARRAAAGRAEEAARKVETLEAELAEARQAADRDAAAASEAAGAEERARAEADEAGRRAREARDRAGSLRRRLGHRGSGSG